MRQSFLKVTIELSSDDLELSRAGHQHGDRIQAQQEIIDGQKTATVWFGAKGSATDCVAYIGENCKLI